MENLTCLVAGYSWALAVGAGIIGTLALAIGVGGVAYRRLGRRNACLETAIGYMSQGLTMFDASGRLVLCNDRYIQMYGLSADVVRPGLTVSGLIEHRIETGSLTMAEAEHYVHERLTAIEQDKSFSIVVELPDRRTIVVTRQPMPAGGWVATHEDVTDRRQVEARLAHMANHDALTDLPNRASLCAQLATALARVRRDGHLSVLSLDLDRFKSINDTLGHAIGDDLLKDVANRLRACLRETDLVARLGGDEFAIVQTEMTDPTDAERLARRVRDAITVPFEMHGQQILVDVSIGISVAPGDSLDADQLLKNADMALSGAKSDGAGTLRFFESEMDARVKARRTLEVDLRKAIAGGEFELYYQPLVNLERNEVCGCEALLRWHHPERGMVSPAEFIPVAEETGLIGPLGEWVLRTACNEAATWPDHVTVAVNVSPVQFKRETLVLTVISALAASGLPARRLAIEITEAVLMRDNEATLATLHQLRDLGVRIVMDDFGTGYSSLSYLRSFPFDKIKIDRSFINDLSKKGEAGVIVQAMTSLASNLNMTTTAEGAETEAQLDQIRALGCTEMQGFLFSRPARAEDIARLFTPGARLAAAE
jgi:diguanylate cyclase (GGDEF)-like protein